MQAICKNPLVDWKIDRTPGFGVREQAFTHYPLAMTRHIAVGTSRTRRAFLGGAGRAPGIFPDFEKSGMIHIIYQASLLLYLSIHHFPTYNRCLYAICANFLRLNFEQVLAQHNGIAQLAGS